MKEPRTYYVKKTHHKDLTALAKSTEKESGISTSVSSIICMILDKFFKGKKKK